MYKSPIEIVDAIQEKVTLSLENNVVRAVQAVGINIDKHALIAALMQDKSRYEAAYEQGKKDTEKYGRWIEDGYGNGGLVCSVCGEPCATFSNLKPRDRYCKWCGAKMEGEDDDSDKD